MMRVQIKILFTTEESVNRILPTELALTALGWTPLMGPLISTIIRLLKRLLTSIAYLQKLFSALTTPWSAVHG